MYFCLPPASSFCLPLDAKLFLPHVNGSLANHCAKAWHKRFWLFLFLMFFETKKIKIMDTQTENVVTVALILELYIVSLII